MLQDDPATPSSPTLPHRPLGVTLLGIIYLLPGLLWVTLFWAQDSSFYETFGAIHALSATWCGWLIGIAIPMSLALGTGFLR